MAQKVNMTQYVQALAKINSKVIPGAVRETLNDTAFRIRKKSIEGMAEKLTNRNRWSEKSIRVDQARGSDIHQMKSVVGSVLPHMKLHEHGGVVRARRSKLGIPTDKSRIGGNRAKRITSRKKLTSIGDFGAKGTKAFAANLRKKGLYIRNRKRLIMLRNFEHSAVTIKPTHWLSEPTFKEATSDNFNRRFKIAAERALSRR